MNRILIVALLVTLGLLPVAVPAQSAAVAIYINGQLGTFDQPPVTQNGRVFVPMRGVFQALGASVVYANRRINATGRGRTVSLTIGSLRATVDGQIQYLDVAPFLVGARTMIPLRFVAQALGAVVNWNQAANSVTIYTGGEQSARRTYFVFNMPMGSISTHVVWVRFQLSRPVAQSTLTVRLDGVNAQYLQQDGRRYSFKTPYLSAGSHRVRVWGQAEDGTPFDLEWTFEVTPTP